MNFKKTAADFKVGERIRVYNWKDAHAAAAKHSDASTGDFLSNIYGIPKSEWLRLAERELKVLDAGGSKGSVVVSRPDGIGVYYVPAYLVYKVKGERK